MLWRMSECLVSSSSLVIEEEIVVLYKVHVLKLNAFLWFQLGVKLDLENHSTATSHIVHHQHDCMKVNRTIVQNYAVVQGGTVVITESSAPW